MKIDKNQLKQPSTISLIIANLFPLIGVIFFNWDTFYIVLLYWAENIIIGFYTAIKMFTAKADNSAQRLLRIAPIAFFIFHYGMFCTVHGVFVFVLFSKDRTNYFSGMLVLAFTVLFVSRGISYIQDYIIKGKYLTAKFPQLMAEPYPRIIPLHIAIIFGGWVVMALGSPIGILIVLIILKTGMELTIDKKLNKRKSR